MLNGVQWMGIHSSFMKEAEYNYVNMYKKKYGK
jgi:hypothetical protein